MYASKNIEQTKYNEFGRHAIMKSGIMIKEGGFTNPTKMLALQQIATVV